MYSNAIMNEFYNPANFGVIRGANGVGKVVCEQGNEIIKIFITVEGDKITAAEFQTFGGVVAIALTSFANNLMIGKTLKEASKIGTNDIMKLAENVPENRMYLVHAVVNCAHLAIESVSKKGAKDVD
jgi:NifU-like protein involved in Fe-S cluster formation